MNDITTSDNIDLDIISSLLSQKRILFAHQSVGFNLLNGISLIYSETNNTHPSITQIDSTYAGNHKGILHLRIGTNRNPISKIHEFENALNSHSFPLPEIAALKLCYVDILGKSSPLEIFNQYTDMITRISNKYPNISIMHFTMPLMSKTSIVYKVKHLLRESPFTRCKENKLRMEYNQLIINKFCNEGFVFDIATLESETTKNEQCSCHYQGQSIPFMCDEYTTDGGHLNEIGQRMIAKQFLISLYRICKALD